MRFIVTQKLGAQRQRRPDTHYLARLPNVLV